MDVVEARGLIARGEGQRIEFKRSFAEQNKGIVSLCAFIHADGGTVFFGATDEGVILGVDIGLNTLEHFANTIHANTDPPLSPSIEVVNIDSREIVAATVQKASPGELFYAFGIPYVRVGKTNQVMTPPQQLARLRANEDRWAGERDRQTHSPVSPEKPVAVRTEGHVEDNRVRLSVLNESEQPHKFKVRLNAATTSVEGSPQLSKWLPLYMRWDSSENDAWETIGPRQFGTVDFARAQGEYSGEPIPYRDVLFQVVGVIKATKSKLHTYVPWGGHLECEIEIQADAVLADPGPQTWILKLRNKMPYEFKRKH